MWVASVKHFANATNSVVVEMMRKGFEKFSSAGLVLGMHFQPRINERARLTRPTLFLDDKRRHAIGGRRNKLVCNRDDQGKANATPPG